MHLKNSLTLKNIYTDESFQIYSSKPRGMNQKAIQSVLSVNSDTRYKVHLTAGEWNESRKRSEASKQHWKDPFVSLRRFNWLWTNYVILSQVAAADGLVQWPVSIRGQGGLLLGMDAPLLGSLPAWVPSCLLLLLGANRANKVARFQAGVKHAIRQWSAAVRRLGTHTHTHTHTRTLTQQTANGASHTSLSRDRW